MYPAEMETEAEFYIELRSHKSMQTVKDSIFVAQQ